MNRHPVGAPSAPRLLFTLLLRRRWAGRCWWHGRCRAASARPLKDL